MIKKLGIEITEIAVFGGGCFWCTEAAFQRLKGVISVTSGYAGGRTENPDYAELHGGKTGHAEVIKVEFDPQEISYETLLAVFFSTHDPTTLNRQGHDVGEEYRSLILYTSDSQKEKTESYIEKLKQDKVFENPIITQPLPLKKFYEAELEHKNFYERNKQAPYCRVVIDPKIQKLQQMYAHLLK